MGNGPFIDGLPIKKTSEKQTDSPAWYHLVHPINPVKIEDN